MKTTAKITMIFLTSLSAHATSVNGFDLGVYGFIKSSATYADKALGSYNNINMSAPTHAVAQTRSQDRDSRFGFQTQQTRIGTTFTKDKLSGKLEFDFIDFNKSSPTTQMNPRLRIAAVTYAWGDNNKFIIGQDWDLFSPVTSFTFDYVGLYFLAGNTGFMRQQAQYLKTLGSWEIGAALGMAGNNPGVTDSDLELGKSPTYSARVSKAIENGRTGVSVIYSTLHYATSNGSKRDAYGYNAFYEQRIGQFNLKSEAYYGQNLANLGTLSIGKGTNTSNANEYGGMLSGQYLMNETQTIFAGAGLAKIDNKGQLSPFALTSGTASTQTISSPGIARNFLSRVGYEHKITPDLSWLSEISRYETSSKISSTEYDLQIAYGIESGIQLRF